MAKTGVKNIFVSCKIPAAVTAFFTLFFAGTAALSALTPPPGTPVVNTAAVSYSDASGNAMAEKTATVQTPISGAPVLSVNKIAGTNPAAMGSVVTYAIEVANTGNIASGGIVLTDSLSKHLEFQSASSGGVYAPGPPEGGTVTWNISPLVPGQSVQFNVSARVKTPADYPPGDPDIIGAGTLIPNTATAVSPETSASATIQITVGEGPNIGICQTVSSVISEPGGILTYTLKYGNTGNMPANGVFITNQLPEGTALVENSITGGGTLSGGIVTWHIGDLAPGSEGVVAFSVQISPLAQEGTFVSNAPSISSIQQSGVLCAPVHTFVSDISASAEVTKSGVPETVSRGNEITYTINVANNGGHLLTGVVVSDKIPENTEFVSADNNGIFTGTEVIWNIGVLEPSEIRVLTLVLKASSAVSGDEDIINTVELKSGQLAALTAKSSNSVTSRTQGQISFFDENWNPADTFSVGETLYIQVTDFDQNTDPQEVESVVVIVTNTDTGDTETVVLTETGPDTGVFRGALPTDTGPPVSENGILTVAFNTAVEATYQDALDPVPVVTSIAYMDPVDSELSITKTATRSVVSIGDIVRYTVTVENRGITPVTNVVVTDRMPHGIAYVKGSTHIDKELSADPETQSARTLAWTIEEIPAGESVQLLYSAVVGPDSYRGSGRNTVKASGMSVGKTVVSPDAFFTVRINEGVFTSKGTIIGKVFIDGNRNRIQDEGEPGVGGVVLYMQDGTRVTTDEEGKYSIPGVRPGTHVIRLDEMTLPEGFTPVPLSNRFMGSSSSQFVDMVPGGLFKANFAVEEEVPAGKKGVPAVKSIQVASFGKNNLDKALQEARVLENKGYADVRVEQVESFYTVRLGSYGTEQSAQADLNRLKEEYPGIFLRNAYWIPERVVYPEIQVEKHGNEKDAGNEKQGLVASPEKRQAFIEEKILSMTPETDFLYPGDGMFISRNNVNVLLKAPMGAEVFLFANGRQAGSDRIGMKVESPESRVTVYEFIGIRLQAGEKNILRAEVRDGFGNIRETREIAVFTAGNPHRIVVKANETRVQADGVSSVQVKAYVEDVKGNRLTYPSLMTVNTSAGEIIEKDADSYSPGTQVLCVDGIARFTILSPHEPATAAIEVFYDNLSGEETVFFAPHIRPMLVVGYGELAIGYGKTGGDTSKLEKEWLKEGFSSGGRGAVFLKGDIGKGFLLTAAYDSAKEKQEDIFNEHVRNTETEDKYPIYGDESKIGYEAQSREKLYVRVDKEESYIMYGDFQTGFTDTGLAAYTRTFTGMKSELNAERFSLHTFLSHTDQAQKIDTIPARGISGYYFLTSRPVIEGSERVIIETRDRIRSERIIKRETKIRGLDYIIDYDIGGILFKSAIPSFDSDLNPVFIVVAYETTGTGKKYLITGSRLKGKILPWLEVGLTGVKEEREIEDKTLIGTDITLSLPGKTTVRAEWAHTRNLFDEGGVYSPKSGTGWSFDIESNPDANLLFSAYYRNIGDYFGNRSAFGFMRGTEKYGIEAKMLLEEKTWFKTTYYNEKDSLNDSSHHYAGIAAGRDLGNTKIEMELYIENSDGNYIAPPDPSSRHPFDFSEEIPEEAAGVKLKMEHRLSPSLAFSLSHKQNFLASDGTLSSAGIDYKLEKNRNMYIRQEYGKFAGRSETRTALGVETDISPSTSAFNEYRLHSGIEGQSSHQSIGLRNKFNLAENVTGNFRVERINTLSGDERQSRPDSFAAAVAMEYLPREKFKITSRLEYRHETRETSRLAEIGAVCMFHPDYSVLFRQRLFINDFSAGGERLTSRTMLGMAYRPVNYDRFNALGRIEFKVDKDTESFSGYNETSYIGSIEGNYQLNPRTQLTGKYAGKFSRDFGFSSYTDLMAGRIIYDITDRFDIGVEARMLNAHKTNTTSLGGSAELGYRVVRNFWLSAGYSFDRFDEDLTGSFYSGKGPYLILRLKFD